MINWRCLNEECCEHMDGKFGYGFESMVPVCPKCKLDGRKGDGKGVIRKLATIHFDPPRVVTVRIKGKPKRGQNTRACQPKTPIFGLHEHASSYPPAVNCGACRKTEVWKKAMERYPDEITEFGVPPEDRSTMADGCCG